jgi:hypothetical protein
MIAFIFPECHRATPHVSLSCPVRHQKQMCQCQCHGLAWDGPMVGRASDRQRLADMVGTLHARRSPEHRAFRDLRVALGRDPETDEWQGLLARRSSRRRMRGIDI